MIINTTAGKTYAVTPQTDCTVSTTDGVLIASCAAGEQTLFVAPGAEVEVSDDSALVTESFKGAPAGLSAVWGSIKKVSASLSSKLNVSTFNAHQANTTIHVTAQEREKWNSKQDNLTDESGNMTLAGNITVAGGTFDGTVNANGGINIPLAVGAVTDTAAVNRFYALGLAGAMSALAGQLISRIAGSAIVTAPAKAATDVLAQFAGEKFRFIAPDALLASDEQADWLVVDEAAAIPAPLLYQLVSRFPRTLLTTTVQGYEGTGRGFLLKFCARFPHLHRFELQQPIRWAQGCPLEKMVSEALVFDDENFTHTPQGNIVISAFEQTLWRSEPETPLKVYQLLSGAHYRTSPLDLRRMMDAPGQHFLQAAGENEIAGALCLVDEGGLSQELSQAVWAGYRRPRGNLVAQSLAAHGSNPLAATLRGRRVSRIAVHPARQREGTGRQLIAGALQYIHDLDYLSVSFGYTEELWRFWQRCGFVLVRMGNHREASSGCYTAMALLPMSDAGKQLAEREHYRLRRDAQALAQWNGEMLPVDPLNDAVLSDDDWLELAGFAFAHRPLLTSLGCLMRLLQTSELALPALRGRLQKNASDAQLCTTLKLSGRKLLLVRQREEAAQALFALDDVCTERLRDRITQWQFFH